MIIYAHRGNLKGPSSSYSENSLDAVGASIRGGFGVEIDLWEKDGQLFVSHEQCDITPACDVAFYEDILASANGQGLALNVKCKSAVLPTERLIKRMGLKEAFLFDMELVGAVPDPNYPHALRVSDLPAEDYRKRTDLHKWSYLWVDEMQREWVCEAVVHELRMRTAGQIVWVSPELHGRPYRQRWLEARCWPLDGICTDFPVELRQSWS